MNDLTHAKALRSSQTHAEQRLWYFRRAKRFMGLKFKRQKPIGRYIVDFVCLECGVVVEVDGGQHNDHIAYDQRRDHWLESQGLLVLRFWNNDVLENTEAVLDRLVEAVQGRMNPANDFPSPPTPLP
jgi:very-short-patch-repair endonuclease